MPQHQRLVASHGLVPAQAVRQIKDTARDRRELSADQPSEARVASLIVRGLLIISGTVTGWFVASDAPNFSFIQGMVSLLVVAVVVFVIAFWPARWTHLLDRRNKPE
jgi:CHASE2 domain-containing sensor protein